MTNPISFISSTPRFALPNLFVAQAQKEFTVNEALARLDSLLYPAVEGEANEAPASPANGESWIIGDQPTGEWEGRSGQLASRQAGNWLFLQPVPGMAVLDKSTGTTAFHDGDWQRAGAIAAPVGGPAADSEARAAISALIAALVTAGIVPAA